MGMFTEALEREFGREPFYATDVLSRIPREVMPSPLVQALEMAEYRSGRQPSMSVGKILERTPGVHRRGRDRRGVIWSIRA
jgi:hypothetical protein